ncbi:MAG: DUF29 family protein [Chromatiaceae bacterium]|nr:MAG: DUF29 family protein [Chromatiaceae bacterium]
MGQSTDIDAGPLTEAIAAMGRREHNELVSRLIVLIAHLLRWAG